MSEQKIDQQEEKNNARRSRKDQQGRDYVCGCGKSYLSYPALYTHIKTKHDGQKPEGTLKVTSSTTTRKICNGPNQVDLPNPSGLITKSSGFQPAETPPPEIEKCKMPLHILNFLQELTTIADYQTIQLLAELTEQVLGYCHPDNRIILEVVGQPIYQKYSEFIEMREDSRLQKIGGKSQIQLIMVTYLLGIGRYVCAPVMKIYMDFCRLFRDCFADHCPDIYDVCFKHRQGLFQARETHKDDLDKNYEYSYLPSSRKAKSSTANTHSNYQFYVPNLLINTREARYMPIIVDFFARVYIPNFETREDLSSIMILICFDFCNWMFRAKITNVQINFLAVKTEILRKQQFISMVETECAALVEAKKIADQTKKQQGIAAKISPNKQKQKRKQRKIVNKSRDTNFRSAVNTEKNQNNSPIQSSEQEDRVDEMNNEDEDSFKIGHQIVQQLHARDRSGSIHQYVNGTQLIEGMNQEPHEDQIQGQQEGVHLSEHNIINDQEIEQYINT